MVGVGLGIFWHWVMYHQKTEKNKTGISGCGSFVVAYFQPATSIDVYNIILCLWLNICTITQGLRGLLATQHSRCIVVYYWHFCACTYLTLSLSESLFLLLLLKAGSPLSPAPLPISFCALSTQASEQNSLSCETTKWTGSQSQEQHIYKSFVQSLQL